jgi:glycosyltransferase involved in cell wall biosynthesis
MNDLVSVILPVRNGEKYVGAAVESVLRQTYPQFELVVVDASTDATPAILRRYNDPRIAYRRQRTQGSVGAYNEALDRYISGAYVTFIHHDDLYHPDKLYEQVKMMERFADVDCVYNDIRYGSERMDFVKYDIHEDFYRRTADLAALSFIGAGIRNGGMNILIRRSFLKARPLRYAPAFPICCDAKYIMDMAGAGARFKLVAKPLYQYRMHETNYSGNYEEVEAEFVRLLHAYGEDKVRAAVAASGFSDGEKAIVLGRALFRMRLLKQAEAHFRARLQPDASPWLYFYWGVGCYKQRGDIQEAKAAFAAGARQLPHKPEFTNNLACCAYALGDRSAARALFAAARENADGYFDPHYNLAQFDAADFVPRLTPFDTDGSRYAGR